MDRSYKDTFYKLFRKHSNEADFLDYQSEGFKQKVLVGFQNYLDFFEEVMSLDEQNYIYSVFLSEFLHNEPINIKFSEGLVKNKVDWLDEERKAKAGWLNRSEPLASYRTRYLEYLRTIGRSDKVVEEVAVSSLSILEKIADPKASSSFLKKGLVVGSVQSGKTGNFNAVINSSIDLGYRMIIVLSGGMEDLRKQTQERIEKEVEGREYKQGEFKGVGKIFKFGQAYQNAIEQIVIPTSLERDFNLGLTEADFALNKINVLVCKKNTAILKNILVWLRRYEEQNRIDNIPLLIIDDEADNASLNNLGHKGREAATKINLQIRCMLNMFSKASYIGYTATPFANILQDRNERPDSEYTVHIKGTDYVFRAIGNLFPDDFIELLNTPSNYIGPKNFFETKISETKKIPSLITTINDWYNEFPYRVYKEDLNEPFQYNIDDLIEMYGSEVEAKRYIRKFSVASKKDCNFPRNLPESLKDAVKCYVIVTAVRLKRKKLMKDSVLFQKDNTMLIHISRFTTWQDRTTVLLKDYFVRLKESLNNELIDSDIYKDFRRIWNKYFLESIENGMVKDFLPDDYKDEFMQRESFNTILDYLITAVNEIEIVCANSTSGVNLDYSEQARNYIVVGGNRLSRGFTLEGLTINYFVRDTNYADSLLQMGRWFGYRPGYLDCCKLFTTIETVESFDFTTSVLEDIEAQFSHMVSKNRTPSDFAIKVMNDPDVIKLTRPAILKNGQTIRWSYSNKLDQTTRFVLDQNRISQAWESFLKFFENRNFKNFGKKEKPIIKYVEITVDELFKLLEMPNSFDNPKHYEPLIAFIRDVKDRGVLNNWTVGIRVSGNGEEIASCKEKLNFSISPAIRRISENKITDVLSKGKFTASGNSSNILTAGSDFAIGLGIEQQLEVEKEFEIEKGTRNFPEKIYRQLFDKNRGVIIIYPIDTKDLSKDRNENENKELKDYLLSKGIDGAIPILGYAIGIPNLGDDFEKEYFVQQGFLDEFGNIRDQFLDIPLSDEIDENEEDKYDDELKEYGNE